MTPTMEAICRRLGRRPTSERELTDQERRALASEAAERRDATARPIEKRKDQ